MKKSELKSSIKEEIIEILNEEGTITTDDAGEAEKLAKKGIDVKLTEEDEEPTAKQLKGDSVATIANKLQQTTKEMKSTVNKWKTAEGEEKQKLRDKLLKLTNIKKELESML